MDKDEKAWLIRDIVCNAFLLFILYYLYVNIVIMSGSFVKSLSSIYTDTPFGFPINAGLVLFIVIVGVTALLVGVTIHSYNQVKIGRKELLKLAETNKWRQITPQNISFDKKYFVIIDVAKPPLIFMDEVSSGTYAKALEKRYVFHREGNFIFVSDKIYSEKRYLFSNN